MKYNGTTFLKVTNVATAASVVASTVNTSSVDCKDADAALFAISVGTLTGTVDVKLQESDDDATFTDISGAAFAQFTSSRHEGTFIGGLNLGERKRYIRANIVIASAAAIYAADFITTSNRELPVTQPTGTTVEFEI